MILKLILGYAQKCYFRDLNLKDFKISWYLIQILEWVLRKIYASFFKKVKMVQKVILEIVRTTQSV